MVRRAAWYNGHMTDQTQITLTAPRSVDMALIVGPADETLRLVQDSFQARITVRGDAIVLEGDPIEVQSLTALFSDLIKLVEDGGEPTCDYVRRAIDLLRTAEFSPQTLREDILLTYRGRAIRPKTAGQKRYVDAVREHTVTFGIGPAGTGKTYLAMAMAVAALKRKDGALFYLEKLAVLPHARRRGLGRALVEHCAQAARRAGGERLSIGVMYENRALVRWYEQASFVRVGTRTFPHLPFLVCFMERDLKESA